LPLRHPHLDQPVVPAFVDHRPKQIRLQSLQPPLDLRCVADSAPWTAGSVPAETVVALAAADVALA